MSNPNTNGPCPADESQTPAGGSSPELSRGQAERYGQEPELVLFVKGEELLIDGAPGELSPCLRKSSPKKGLDVGCLRARLFKSENTGAYLRLEFFPLHVTLGGAR